MPIKSWVLMTAMPPTKGHYRLIEFASNLSVRVEVVVCTQPDEPMCHERMEALDAAFKRFPNVHINRIHETLPQEPDGEEGFWDMWAGFLTRFGFERGDAIVASESYGKTLADFIGGVFYPYDIERSLYPSKASNVRSDLISNFDKILPEFQPELIKRITIFGAESTGKTTLSKLLAQAFSSHWLYEYARPYLENTTNVVDENSMHAIWYGQRAAQLQASSFRDKPFIFQDTDLFSTLGYWEMAPWDREVIGPVPAGLSYDCQDTESDLYIITRSNIPFEVDPLRYGGDKREISDDDWIDFANSYGLNYVILESDSLWGRLAEAETYVLDCFHAGSNGLSTYKRLGKEYK